MTSMGNVQLSGSRGAHGEMARAPKAHLLFGVGAGSPPAAVPAAVMYPAANVYACAWVMGDRPSAR